MSTVFLAQGFLKVFVVPQGFHLVKKKKPRNHVVSRFFCGAADQIRTGDLILTKDALYRLSYSSKYGDPERARTVDL